jgi:hypothetical protein
VIALVIIDPASLLVDFFVIAKFTLEKKTLLDVYGVHQLIKILRGNYPQEATMASFTIY